MSIFIAYIAWTLGTLCLFYLAIRRFEFPVAVQMAVLLSPAAMMNALLGQNGALTSALLLGGLWSLGNRQWWAGVLFGLLTIKPHLGILIPVILLAGGYFRAIAGAVITTVLLLVLTGLLFGWHVWVDFRNVTMPLMGAIMEADFPQPYHANAMTVFVTARWLGASVAVAHGMQLVSTLAAALVAVRLWRPSANIDPARRIAITGLLVLLATPYGYSYDAVALAPAVAWGFLHERRIPMPVHGFVWLFPLFVHVANLNGIGAAIIVPLAYAGWHVILAFSDMARRPALP